MKQIQRISPCIDFIKIWIYKLQYVTEDRTVHSSIIYVHPPYNKNQDTLCLSYTTPKDSVPERMRQNKHFSSVPSSIGKSKSIQFHSIWSFNNKFLEASRILYALGLILTDECMRCTLWKVQLACNDRKRRHHWRTLLENTYPPHFNDYFKESEVRK